MKILVVDDEALLVKGIRFNLQNEGYEVITGSDGLEAVEQVKKQNPDLVVLDVMMPNMDGMTACGKIREFSDVPIILLTAKTDDMDKLMGFEHGADDYLTKPFNILELKARIRALLRRTGPRETRKEDNTLSIGTILLQQFITMRSQKAQNKYSSVDGQQAMTQKTTMIVMTLMFGIFAFMYSSAFSIYMITSSIFSLLSTMLINKLVDISMNKKEAQAMQEKYTRTLPGRKQPEPKNKKKK